MGNNRVIGDDGRPVYGIFGDLPLQFNYRDYRLLDFFDRRESKLGRFFKFHAFHYIGISVPPYWVGIAVADLDYVAKVFVFLAKEGEGVLYDHDATLFFRSRNFRYPKTPDAYEMEAGSGKLRVRISKSFDTGLLSFAVEDGNLFSAHGEFDYRFEKQNPLRVLTPSEFNGWTFTEKCARIPCRALKINLKGLELPVNPGAVSLLYDWSAGYMKRLTTWLWAAFTGADATGIPAGGNFSAFVNETFYSENVAWHGEERFRTEKVIFEMDLSQGAKSWRIFSESGSVNLLFQPDAERRSKENYFFLKSWFRQFTGFFSGSYRLAGGKTVTIEHVPGVAEIHRTLW